MSCKVQRSLFTAITNVDIVVPLFSLNTQGLKHLQTLIMALEYTLDACEVPSFHRTLTGTFSGTGSRAGIITGIGTGSSIRLTLFFLPNSATTYFLHINLISSFKLSAFKLQTLRGISCCTHPMSCKSSSLIH